MWTIRGIPTTPGWRRWRATFTTNLAQPLVLYFLPSCHYSLPKQVLQLLFFQVEYRYLPVMMRSVSIGWTSIPIFPSMHRIVLSLRPSPKSTMPIGNRKLLCHQCSHCSAIVSFYVPFPYRGNMQVHFYFKIVTFESYLQQRFDIFVLAIFFVAIFFYTV